MITQLFSIIINIKGTPERNHHYTLLDGEMIIDRDPHTHKQERRYLIYDLMAINQVSLTEVHIYWQLVLRYYWLLSWFVLLLLYYIK